MKSPLTTFLYVLMRDHLPTGTVRWLIEQSQLDGDPVYAAPELEQLAKRYADELLMAPPRKSDEQLRTEASVHEALASNGTPTPSDAVEEEEQVDADEDEDDEAEPERLELRKRPAGKGGGPSIATRIESAMLDGRWMKGPEIAEAINITNLSLRGPLQTLVREGAVKATGHTQNRRYRLLPVTNAPGGALPVKSLPAPPPKQEPAEKIATPGSRAKGAGEEDVFLMARVGDYIQESDSPVYAGEIEAVFGISAERRRRILEMLLERNRILAKGKPPRQTYVYRSEVPDHDSGPDAPHGVGHFRPKPPEKRTQLSAADIEQIKSWAKHQRTFKRRTVAEAFPNLDSTMIGPALSRLAAEGFLKARNEDGHLGGGISYVVASNGRDNTNFTTLEGRLMGLLGSEWTSAAALCKQAGASRDDTVIALDKLVREGLIRRDRPTSNIPAVYAAV